MTTISVNIDKGQELDLVTEVSEVTEPWNMANYKADKNILMHNKWVGNSGGFGSDSGANPVKGLSDGTVIEITLTQQDY